MLYDEYKLYITLDLVKSLVSEYMSEFLVSDVLAQLSEAGILSDSIVKTLTLSTGHPKNVRLRSINSQLCEWSWTPRYYNYLT